MRNKIFLALQFSYVVFIMCTCINVKVKIFFFMLNSNKHEISNAHKN